MSCNSLCEPASGTLLISACPDSRQPIESETAEDEKRIRSALKQFETKVGKETKTLKPVSPLSHSMSMALPPQRQSSSFARFNVLQSAAQTRQSLDPTKRKSASEVRRREKHLKAIRDEQAEEEALFEASRAKKRVRCPPTKLCESLEHQAAG